MNSFKFHMSGKSLFRLHSISRILGVEFWVYILINLFFYYCILTCILFSDKSAIISIFVPFIILWNLIMMGLDVFFFLFLVLRTSLRSCNCGFTIFSDLEKNLVIIYSNILFYFSLFFFLGFQLYIYEDI